MERELDASVTAPSLSSADLRAGTEPSVGGTSGSTDELRHDVAQSVRNAAMLGGSLLGTWAVALVVRIVLPRHLGPAPFGTFQFADSFATALFAMMSFGVDTYIRKEIATRPAHATDFFGGMLLIRLALSAVVMAACLLVLGHSGKPDVVLRLVFVLGVAQVLANINLSYAALLQAGASVRGLSLLNVACKVIWGAGILLVIARGGAVEQIGIPIVLAELLRLVGLTALSRRHLGLRFQIRVRETAAVMVASLPFYLAGLAQTVYGGIDVTVLSFLVGSDEVGWYGAAANIAGLSFLLSPLIGWVLLPLSSRAASRSQEELSLVTRRAMEFVLTLSFPATLMLAIGADVIVAKAFGAPFAPAAASLRILAPTTLCVYVTMVSSSILVRLNRGWAVTWISVSTVVISPLLNLALVPRFFAHFGPGGGGQGAAISLLLTEFYAAALMTWLLGRRAFDAHNVRMVVKTCAVSAVVAVVDHFLLWMGAWRLLADGLLYALLAIGSGAVNPRALVGFVSGALRTRGAGPTVPIVGDGA
jgi:O-antigen/teichoic acid export membrane protein